MKYKGKKILFTDYSNADASEVISILNESIETTCKQEKESVLLITDVTDARYDKKSWQIARERVKETRPYVKATAVIGIEGPKKFMFTVLKMVSKRQHFKVFDDIEDAKEWLISV